MSSGSALVLGLTIEEDAAQGDPSRNFSREAVNYLCSSPEVALALSTSEVLVSFWVQWVGMTFLDVSPPPKLLPSGILEPPPLSPLEAYGSHSQPSLTLFSLF